jgi:hypothetical protein
MDDFKEQLTEYARKAVGRSGRVENEQATRQFLIIPFLELLGYDPFSPDEIVPEVDASFSDKHKSKVDYAIFKDEEPVIAIESKKVGSLKEANKGELKGYFNAVPSVKLGILTDGLVYQLFSDTGQANMMDDQPFVSIDLKEIAQDRISDGVFDALLKLRKGSFNPADVGSDARRRLHMNAYMQALEVAFETPQKEYVRALMDLAGVEGNRTAKLIEDQTAVVKEAMSAFFDRKLLERVGFANREDIVRVPESSVPPDPTHEQETDGLPKDNTAEVSEPGVETTDAELQVFDYVKRRLPFLIDRDDALFGKLDHVFMRDRKVTLIVSYKQERRGKLFNFKEGKDPKYRFEFAGSGTRIDTNELSDIDNELLAVFLQRVQELG